MKPDPGAAERRRLRRYVETVAGLLGVEPAACWSECDAPSTAYIALADEVSGLPGRFLMLQWSSDSGWCLAVEPEGHEPPAVLATWPVPVRPRPAQLAHRVRAAVDDERRRRRVCAH